MIDLSDVPFAVRRMVKDSQDFSDDNWREIVIDWHPQYTLLIRTFLSMGEDTRRENLRNSPSTIQDVVLEGRAEGIQGVPLAIALYCLSDEKLKFILSLLVPEEAS